MDNLTAQNAAYVIGKMIDDKVIRNQAEIVDMTGFERGYISRVVNGKHMPNTDFIRKFNEAYANTLTTKVTNDSYTPPIQSNAVQLDNPGIMLVPLVEHLAYAGYTNAYYDMGYVEELPKEPFFVGRAHKGNYMAFEVRGDSMDDGTRASICDRDILLGRELSSEHWQNKLHIHKWNFIIVLKEEGILFKQILFHNVPKGIITVHSLNPAYHDQEIALDRVAKLFNVVQVNRKQS